MKSSRKTLHEFTSHIPPKTPQIGTHKVPAPYLYLLVVFTASFVITIHILCRANSDGTDDVRKSDALAIGAQQEQQEAAYPYQ
jgi:hypothetical protein